MAYSREYLRGVLPHVDEARISFKEQKRLRKELARRILEYPAGPASRAVQETNELLRRRDASLGDALPVACSWTSGWTPEGFSLKRRSSTW